MYASTITQVFHKIQQHSIHRNKTWFHTAEIQTSSLSRNWSRVDFCFGSSSSPLNTRDIISPRTPRMLLRIVYDWKTRQHSHVIQSTRIQTENSYHITNTLTHSLTAARNQLWVVAPSMSTGRRLEPMRQQSESAVQCPTRSDSSV